MIHLLSGPSFINFKARATKCRAGVYAVVDNFTDATYIDVYRVWHSRVFLDAFVFLYMEGRRRQSQTISLDCTCATISDQVSVMFARVSALHGCT